MTQENDTRISFSLPGWSGMAPFVLAILGFFMVFTEINCNGEQLASLTGMDLVTGSEGITDEEERSAPNIWAIISLSAAVIGIIAWLLTPFRTQTFSLIAAGVIGLASMVVLYYDLKGDARDELENSTKDEDGFNMDMDLDVDVEMKFGYWFVVICFAIALVINGLRSSQLKESVPDDKIRESQP